MPPMHSERFKFVRKKCAERRQFLSHLGLHLDRRRHIRRQRNRPASNEVLSQSPRFPVKSSDSPPTVDCQQLKNDYSQNFVNTGQRPQNFIRDSGVADRFEEYPKLRELIRLKDQLISQTNCPPFYMHVADLSSADLCADLGVMQFDVILLRPPLPDCNYATSGERIWNWSDISQLPIDRLAAQRSFVFLWAGSGNGLDEARHCLRRWGFRRCEDICWIKTNKESKKGGEPGDGIFQRTKEHCLMGIRGTVRRSMDADFIHANVDIDLIISEESHEMPSEIFDIIEHFCLGRRRLHLFGNDCDIRPGWLTVGCGVSNSNYSRDKYLSYFENQTTTGTTDRIEQLRPKSPPPIAQTSGPVAECEMLRVVLDGLLAMQQPLPTYRT